MKPWVVLVVGTSACGRLHFDDRVDAAAADTLAVDTFDGSSSGLLLDFEFESDGLLVDHAPAHHPASCTSCPTMTAGRVGAGAAAFDGTACITIPDAADLHPTAFTFALWLQTSATQRATAFSKPFNGMTDTTNSIEAFVLDTDEWCGSVNSDVIAAATVPQGSWHHFAGVFDGNLLTTYVDGVVAGMPLATGAVAYTGDDFQIGCDKNIGNLEEFLTGDVDEVQLYDHALSAAEVAGLAM